MCFSDSSQTPKTFLEFKAQEVSPHVLLCSNPLLVDICMLPAVLSSFSVPSCLGSVAHCLSLPGSPCSSGSCLEHRLLQDGSITALLVPCMNNLLETMKIPSPEMASWLCQPQAGKCWATFAPLPYSFAYPSLKNANQAFHSGRRLGLRRWGQSLLCGRSICGRG